MEPYSLMAIGTTVYSKAYGAGTLVKVDDDGYATIKFCQGEEKEYKYSSALANGWLYLLEDEAEKSKQHEIELAKIREIEEQKILRRESLEKLEAEKDRWKRSAIGRASYMIYATFPDLKNDIMIDEQFEDSSLLDILCDLGERVGNENTPERINFSRLVVKLIKATCLSYFYELTEQEDVKEKAAKISEFITVNDDFILDVYDVVSNENPCNEFAQLIFRPKLQMFTKERREKSVIGQTDIIIEKDVKKRGITRICHMTQVNKLPLILSDEMGLRATRFIEKDVVKNDRNRYDRHCEYVCCSVEYPNNRYYNSRKDSDPNCTDWAIIFISADVISKYGTCYCRFNAAQNGGDFVSNRLSEWHQMFGSVVEKVSFEGIHTRVERKSEWPKWLTTYDQAEVMPYKNIPLEYIEGIAFQSEDILKNVKSKLDEDGIKYPKLYVAPALFTDHRNLLFHGIRPEEVLLDGGNINGQ